MRILAIDTSADETSVALTEGRKVLRSVISSQIQSHQQWGGIMPVTAKLEHEKRIDAVVKRAMSGHNKPDAVAVTQGPGLSIALEVGIRKAKALAREWCIPLIAVNHMEGHLFSPFVQNSKGHPNREIPIQFLSLLISGGHTQIICAKRSIEERWTYSILGETRDDAAGEALDKAARMLGLGYPGGPLIETLAREVDHEDRYRFPRAMVGDKSLDVSYSGLKTHLHHFLRGEKGYIVDPVVDLKYIASSFQEAVFDTIVRKVGKAIDITGIADLAVGGGVIANKRLRQLLRSLMKSRDGRVYFPSYAYLCGDNAAMIGVAAGISRHIVTDIDSLDRIPRMSLG